MIAGSLPVIAYLSNEFSPPPEKAGLTPLKKRRQTMYLRYIFVIAFSALSGLPGSARIIRSPFKIQD